MKELWGGVTRGHTLFPLCRDSEGETALPWPVDQSRGDRKSSLRYDWAHKALTKRLSLASPNKSQSVKTLVLEQEGVNKERNERASF